MPMNIQVMDIYGYGTDVHAHGYRYPCIPTETHVIFLLHLSCTCTFDAVYFSTLHYDFVFPCDGWILLLAFNSLVHSLWISMDGSFSLHSLCVDLNAICFSLCHWKNVHAHQFWKWDMDACQQMSMDIHGYR